MPCRSRFEPSKARSPARSAPARRRGRCVGAALLVLLVVAACSSSEPPLPRRIVDLTPPISSDIHLRRLGVRALEFLGLDRRNPPRRVLPADPRMAFGLQMLELTTHTGAHLDAPARLLRGGESPDRIALDRLVGPARLVDLRWHNRHSAIQITDLELTPIAQDDVVILFLGYEPPTDEDWPSYAPLSAQASEWLAAKNIRALATDLPAIARFDEIEQRLQQDRPPEIVWAEYLPFFRARIPVIAGLINLDAISKENRVLFGAFPLPLVDTAGAPLRAVAFVY